MTIKQQQVASQSVCSLSSYTAFTFGKVPILFYWGDAEEGIGGEEARQGSEGEKMTDIRPI